jgi:hypothetical protein
LYVYRLFWFKCQNSFIIPTVVKEYFFQLIFSISELCLVSLSLSLSQFSSILSKFSNMNFTFYLRVFLGHTFSFCFRDTSSHFPHVLKVFCMEKGIIVWLVTALHQQKGRERVFGSFIQNWFR